jgi:hypothetical protein
MLLKEKPYANNVDRWSVNPTDSTDNAVGIGSITLCSDTDPSMDIFL